MLSRGRAFQASRIRRAGSGSCPVGIRRVPFCRVCPVCFAVWSSLSGVVTGFFVSGSVCRRVSDIAAAISLFLFFSLLFSFASFLFSFSVSFSPEKNRSQSFFVSFHGNHRMSMHKKFKKIKKVHLKIGGQLVCI